MTLEGKIQILAKFFAKQRVENDPMLDRLFSLDDFWAEAYCEKRKISFFAAQIFANKSVISKVLSDDYV